MEERLMWWYSGGWFGMSEWKEYQLSEIMELIGGGTPKTTVPEYWDGNIPWLSITDFSIGLRQI